MDCGNTLISLTRALISAALSCPVADTTAARTQKNDGSLKIPVSSAFSNRDSYVHHVLVEGDRHGVCTYESLGLEIGVTARDPKTTTSGLAGHAAEAHVLCDEPREWREARSGCRKPA